MKPLLPSLREKKRYVVFKIIGKNIDRKKAEKEIYENLLKFLGEFGVAKANIKIIRNTWKNNMGIIKVNVKHLNETKTSLGLIKKIDNKKVIVDVVGVSGILKKAKQKFLEE